MLPTPVSCASLVPQLVKNQRAMWETWVQSLGWKTALEKGKATPVFWPRESMNCIVHRVANSWT